MSIFAGVAPWAAALALGLPPAPGERSALESIGPAAAIPQQRGKKASPTVLEPATGTLAEARAESRARNAPLVVLIALEGEPQNDEFKNKIPGAREVIAACSGTLVVIANGGTHPPKKVESQVDGKKVQREVCSVFGVLTCAEHQRFWDPVFSAWQQNGELRCPQVVVVSPEGEVAARVRPGEVPSISSVVSAIEQAKKAAGPSLSRAELSEFDRALTEGQRQLEQGESAAAWRAFGAALAVTQVPRWADQAKAGQGQALARIEQQRDAALAELAGDRPITGYDLLVALAQSCKGLPNHKALLKLVENAQSDPAIGPILKRTVHERESETLWTEARELEGQGKQRAAEGKIRQLLRKYYDTPAGKRARKTYPEIAKDEDSRTG